MPYHFLVKRHRNCVDTFQLGDSGHDGHKSDHDDVYTTAILAANKQAMPRETDYTTAILATNNQAMPRETDYYDINSPDSGYSASPNSIHLGLTGEKENIATVRENSKKNNSTNCSSVNTYYTNSHQNVPSTPGTNNGTRFRNISDDTLSKVLEPLDAPLDLSTSNRHTSALSSVHPHLKNENCNENSNKFRQEQQICKCSSSLTNLSSSFFNPAVIEYCKCCNDVCPSDSLQKQSFQKIPSLSFCNDNKDSPIYENHSASELFVDSYYPGTTKSEKTVGTETVAKWGTPSPRQCLSTPTSRQESYTSTPSLLFSQTAASPPSTANPRTTSPKTSSPVRGPKRKREVPHDSMQTFTQDSFLSATNTPHSMNTSTITTPTFKETSVERTTATDPATKKLHCCTVTGNKVKAARRLNFNLDTTSPVSGTLIKDFIDSQPEEGTIVCGDIEPRFNMVEVTREARAELEKIPNRIGDYVCQLCQEFFQDAFQLAQHRCSRIVHVEYRCPECETLFNCPANLASHRRWHKLRASELKKTVINSRNTSAVKCFPLYSECIDDKLIKDGHMNDKQNKDGHMNDKQNKYGHMNDKQNKDGHMNDKQNTAGTIRENRLTMASSVKLPARQRKTIQFNIRKSYMKIAL